MRYSFLTLIVIVISLALIGQPVQGAPYRVDSITLTPAASGVSGVPLPYRAAARLGQGSINAVEISPDSKRIAVGGSVGVTVYEAATLRALWSARGAVKLMKWSPDSALLASDMSGVSVWNGATGRLANRLMDYSPTDLEWSPDSRRLVMASWNGLGLIWYVKADTLPIYLPLPVRECDRGVCIVEMDTALSPDGRLYATRYGRRGGDACCFWSGVFIWDALTGIQKRVLPTWGELKWLHDSTHLLVGDLDHPLTEWDTRTGQPVGMTSVTNDNGPTPEGSFTLPSGELVAWEYALSSIQPYLVDVNTGTLLCNSDHVSPDFKLCVDQLPDVWPSHAPAVVFSEIGSDTEFWRIEGAEIAALSPDWNFLVGWTVSSPGDLNVWKVSNGQMIGRLALSSPQLTGIAWSPDGRRLATVDQEGNNVQLWDAVTGQFVQDLPNPAADAPGYSAMVIRAAFSPDGSRLAVLGIKTTLLVIWDMASAQPVAQTDIDSASGMVWSPDGTEIALVNATQQVFVIDAATGNVQRSTEANAETECLGDLIGYVNGVGWSPDSKQIAVGSCGGEVILYDAATLKKVSTLTYRTGAKPDKTIPYLAYSPDGRSLAAVIPLPDRYILAIWDLRSGQVRIGRIASNSPDLLLPLSSLAWSPNGRFLAVGFGTAESILGGSIIYGGDIAIFNGRTAEQVARLHGHTDDADGISFSPDSKKLASASLDGTVLIWDLTGL